MQISGDEDSGVVSQCVHKVVLIAISSYILYSYDGVAEIITWFSNGHPWGLSLHAEAFLNHILGQECNVKVDVLACVAHHGLFSAVVWVCWLPTPEYSTTEARH